MLEEFQCVPTNFRNSECVNFALILFWGSHVCNSPIYLHCDPTASHYLKIVMDAIFSRSKNRESFRNEIVWCYTGPGSPGMRQFNRKHDTIFWYAAGRSWTFNCDDVRLPHAPKTRANYKKGLKGSGFGDDDRILSSGGKVPESWWRDIAIAARSPTQYLSYPTQKPLALLERIIRASSNEGEIVLDPFCGCGTTIDAARKLRRRWIGIDISSFAIDLIREKRLRDMTIPTRGIPTDLASAKKLATEQPFNFESWAVMRLPGFAPNTKQVGDGGIDGRATLAIKPDNYNSRLALAQIKGGKFSLSQLRDFIGVNNRDKAALGCYVTLDPINSPSARSEVVNTGKISVSGYKYPRIQLWPISDYFDARYPLLPVMNDPYTGKPMHQLNLLWKDRDEEPQQAPRD